MTALFMVIQVLILLLNTAFFGKTDFNNMVAHFFPNLKLRTSKTGSTDMIYSPNCKLRSRKRESKQRLSGAFQEKPKLSLSARGL